MKSKRYIITSIMQLLIGIMAILAFIIIGLNGENLTKWIITLLLAIAYVVLGIVGIIDYKLDIKN